MTTIKIIPSLGSNNESLYTGKSFSCIKCSRGQNWHNRRRYKK